MSSIDTPATEPVAVGSEQTEDRRPVLLRLEEVARVHGQGTAVPVHA